MVEGMTQDSTRWIHQWHAKGSQPGLEVKETSQFLITKSTDEGRTWSEPINITRNTKRPEWWLYAPAPGHGITLKDGTLVFPTQGRDKDGMPFSNIPGVGMEGKRGQPVSLPIIIRQNVWLCSCKMEISCLICVIIGIMVIRR